MRNAQCRMRNMSRNTEKHENEKCTLQELKYDEKPEKHGKLDTNSVGPGVRQETMKKLEKEKFTLYTQNMVRNIKKRIK